MNEIVSLNALDRCDRCRSQAYCVVKKEGVGSLMFCMHHKIEHSPVLEAQGWVIIDDLIAQKELSPKPALTNS